MPIVNTKANRLTLTFWAVISAALGLLFLGSKSLWDDEGFSTAAVKLSTDELFRLTVDRDPHTGLWHLLLSLWTSVFGTSDIGLRCLSVLLGTCTVLALWVLAYRLFGYRAANVTALCFTVSETFLRFAQDARPGMLTALMTVLAISALHRAVTQQHLRSWIWWGVFSALAAYGHPFAVFVTAGATASLLFTPRGTLTVRRLSAALIAFLVTVAPLALLLGSQSGSDNISWIPPLSARAIATGVFLIGGGGFTVTALPALALLAMAIVLTLRLLRVDLRSAWPQVLVILWAITPIILLAVLSIISPSFVAKYLVPAFPGVALAAGYASTAFGRKAFVSLFTVLTLSGIGSVVHWYGIEEKDDWESAVETIESRAVPGDVVMAFGHRAVFDYYAGSSLDGEVEPVLPDRPFGSDMPAHEDLDDTDTAAVTAEIETAQCVFVPKLENDEVATSVTSALEDEFGQPSIDELDGDLELLSYCKSATAE